MKKYLLSIAIILSAFFVNAQDSLKTGKNFEFGIGLGAVGEMNNGGAGKVFGVGLSLQGENHFSKQFSGFISGGYNLLFSTEGGGTLGFIPIQAGPRVYVNKNIFLGVGLGLGIIIGQGEASGFSASGFSYFPQIGINSQKTQVIFGYNSVSLTKYGSVTDGFLDLKIVFKL